MAEFRPSDAGFGKAAHTRHESPHTSPKPAHGPEPGTQHEAPARDACGGREVLQCCELPPGA
jgi:hypothetical protein